jgi:hypothetical protein
MANDMRDASASAINRKRGFILYSPAANRLSLQRKQIKLAQAHEMRFTLAE